MNNSNDEKIKKYKMQQVKKWLIIILSLVVIILEVLALFKVCSMLWGLIIFVLIYILKKIF